MIFKYRYWTGKIIDQVRGVCFHSGTGPVLGRLGSQIVEIFNIIVGFPFLFLFRLFLFVVVILKKTRVRRAVGGGRGRRLGLTLDDHLGLGLLLFSLNNLVFTRFVVFGKRRLFVFMLV